jgi:hypothetical protein
LAGLLAVPLPVAAAAARDLWIHPRGEAYDASKHYRAPNGELYYVAENDLLGFGPVRLVEGEQPSLRVSLGSDLRALMTAGTARVQPVLLWDSNGDARVDRTARGRVEGHDAVFDGPELAGVDFRSARWQLGVRYAALAGGLAELDGRYLASVEGSQAEIIAAPAPEPLPPVATRPPLPPPGLVILKHREGEPFDFAEFVRSPDRYAETFDALTKEADADDWTVEDGRGKLVTHYEREDLFMVRTTGGLGLAAAVGDLPLERFMSETLEVERNGDGCYSTLDSRLRNVDGSYAQVPTRILWCPEQAVALLEAPDGYELDVSALQGAEVYETTAIGNSVRDNLRLYGSEINPRSASRRATATLGGNLAAGFADASSDVEDAASHLVTGRRERHLHTGQIEYRPSPITALPIAVWQFATLKPLAAVGTLFTGAESAVAAGADVVSALNNAAVSPALQLTVGLASLGAANVATDTVGTASQMVMKNLPLGERSNGVIDPRGSWYHNRAFEPARYTRTDTQLNADRAMTIIDLVAINAIRLNNSDNGSSGDGGGAGAGGDGGGTPRGGDGPPLGGGDGTPETPGGTIHECIKWIKHKQHWFRGH